MKFRDIGPYRLFFTTNDRDEAEHIHIEREGRVAKFWLNPVRLAKSSRFAAHELRKMERLVKEYHHDILEFWNDLIRR